MSPGLGHSRNYTSSANPDVDVDLNRCLDLGCGTGHVSISLSKVCVRVTGLDISKEQLDSAFKAENIEYRVSPAENTGLEPASVDAVTSGTAVHWFNVTGFYAEAARVLKPGGVVGTFTYARLAASN